jgi:predicted secreted protein
MAVTSAIVLYAVIWFMVMFVVLPIRLRTQGDEGKVVPGTQAGAPANFNLKRTALIVSAVAFVVWAIIFVVIVSGTWTIRDLDWFGRMSN